MVWKKKNSLPPVAELLSENCAPQINKQFSFFYFFSPFILDPGDSHPVLLIGSSNRIVITHLNGTGLQPLRSLSVNGTLALDFQHSQERVCWALSTESSGQLHCATTRNLRGFTREQEIKTQRSIQRMFFFLPRSQFLLLHCLFLLLL